jgi:hypothetical protein
MIFLFTLPWKRVTLQWTLPIENSCAFKQKQTTLRFEKIQRCYNPIIKYVLHVQDTTIVNGYFAGLLNTSFTLHTTVSFHFLSSCSSGYKNICELQRLKHHSHNPGHLGILLTKRLFPELFRLDYLRREYSYFGAGKLNKTPRSAEKKTYLQRYLIFLYPELQEDRKWKDTVVCRVNEVLRRPAK